MSTIDTTTRPKVTDVAGAALELFGDDARRHKDRVRYLCDTGVLRSIRVGERGTRLIATTDIDRLLVALDGQPMPRWSPSLPRVQPVHVDNPTSDGTAVINGTLDGISS